MKALILMQIEGQLEQTLDCLNAGQFTAAAVHFGECAQLCQLLEAERQTDRRLLQEEKKKQLTMDTPS